MNTPVFDIIGKTLAVIAVITGIAFITYVALTYFNVI